MLRHKLILTLGSMVALLAVTAILTIIVLSGVLEDLTELDQSLQVRDRLRWTVFGLGLVFVVVINLSIYVLLRAASTILRPVDQLVEASRRLAQEDFDYRVEIDQHDEFDELAHAQNQLAAQLQLNEQRRLETLQQVAATLSHELNNAMSIIEMQLTMVARNTGGDPALAEQLRQIHAALRRMEFTVHSLSRVRRIVLTDYVDGVKMLDLEQSTQDSTPVTTKLAETRGS